MKKFKVYYNTSLYSVLAECESDAVKKCQTERKLVGTSVQKIRNLDRCEYAYGLTCPCGFEL